MQDDEYINPKRNNEEDEDYIYVESMQNADVPTFFYYKIDKEKDPVIYEELLASGGRGDTIIIEHYPHLEWCTDRSVWANFMLENNTDANVVNAGPRSIAKISNARWWVYYSSTTNSK